MLLHHSFSKKVNHLLRTLPPDVSQAHIIAPFNDVLKRVVLAILNSNELKAITWQQINLRIDSGGLGIGIDARTSYAAFAASFLSAVKAASEIYIPCFTATFLTLASGDIALDTADGDGVNRSDVMNQRGVVDDVASRSCVQGNSCGGSSMPPLKARSTHTWWQGSPLGCLKPLKDVVWPL